MQSYLEPCIALAKRAGDAIMSIYQEDDIGKQEKSDNTPVTAADIASNEVLMAGLTAIAPDIPVMSEETPIPPLAERQHWQRYWLLDPMDGTGEFILESGDFAVNIALIENNHPVLGLSIGLRNKPPIMPVKEAGLISAWLTNPKNKSTSLHPIP